MSISFAPSAGGAILASQKSPDWTPIRGLVPKPIDTGSSASAIFITCLHAGLPRVRGSGWECLHVAIDDASRLAYTEVLADEKKETVCGFVTRALAWFARQGIAVERIMTDNGSAYRSRAFAQLLAAQGLRHISTRPYTPRTNGKAERFI